MKISIFASIGCQNLGDELILKNEISVFENIYKNSGKIFSKENGLSFNKLSTEWFTPLQFSVFTYDLNDIFYEKENIEYLEYFPIGIKNPKNIFRNIKNFFYLLKTVISSDFIVIGGGGLFFDEEIQKNKNPLNLWILRTKLFYLFRKKVIFYGIGLNIKNKDNLTKIKKIFSKSHEIYVRDSYSKELLKSLNINSNDIWDPVFYDNNSNMDYGNTYLLKSINSKNLSFKELENIDLKGKTVGVAIRKGYISKDKEKEIIIIKEIIDYIIKNGGKVILLPHSFHKTDILANDYIFLNQFINNMSTEGELPLNRSDFTSLNITKNIKETYDIYKERKIDLCLAERLHSIILSQVYKINFIAISYSKKTEEIIKKITTL